MIKTAILAATALTAAAFAFQTSQAYATHSWGNYHWQRTENPKRLDLGDNRTTTNWDLYLETARDKWNDVEDIYTGASQNYPEVIETTIVDGTSNRNCKATSGRVEVCNGSYGFNGWLGLAQIWISGVHITQGVAKLNDSYFDTGTYNTSAWRNLVMCQEVAHTFGLDHQDVAFSNPNLGTCMDYTNDPDGPPTNESPNAHDFEQLAKIYAHTTEVSPKSVRGKGNGGGGFEFAKWVADDFENDWGQAVAFTSKGQPRLFVKDLGGDDKRITHVLWTEDAPPRRD